MKTKENPFKTDTFQGIWKNHFVPKAAIHTFKCIHGVNFYKSGILPVFFNVGRNLTKGNTYRISDNKDIKNKTFVIYDVLPHLNETKHELPKNSGVLKSKQYPGFLIDLNKFKNIDDYLLQTFSKNTRMKMRKFSKRLDACFDISTKMFHGDIDKSKYDELFGHFMTLLKKRYSEKQISYNNMQPAEWNFYKDVAYPLILEKKASLFVIYDHNTPIAITYNYHTEDSVIDAITVFDTDYSKFNIGYVNNLKLLEWCFQNNQKTLDFSKGYFDYKKRMCTLEYDFEYHIIYDKKSISSRTLGLVYHKFFELKTYLRDKHINEKFHKLTYKLKNKKQQDIKEALEVTQLDKLPNLEDLIKINIKEDTNYCHLTKHINDFLYLAVQPYSKIESYKIKNQDNTYVISSSSLIQKIKVNN